MTVTSPSTTQAQLVDTARKASGGGFTPLALAHSDDASPTCFVQTIQPPPDATRNIERSTVTSPWTLYVQCATTKACSH